MYTYLIGPWKVWSGKPHNYEGKHSPSIEDPSCEAEEVYEGVYSS